MSKNEIKERRGVIIFIIALCFPFVLWGGSYLFLTAFIQQLGVSSIARTQEIPSRDSISQSDEELIYKELLVKNKRGVFTGRRNENEVAYTYALHIQVVDSFSIKYRIERLSNWKPKPNLAGIAKLDNQSIGKDNWTIKDGKRTLQPAFRFVGEQEDCPIEILISKTKLGKSIAIVKEICPLETKELTMTMAFK